MTAGLTVTHRRALSFTARVVCRADPFRGPSAAAVLDEPIIVVTATGTVVVPPSSNDLGAETHAKTLITARRV
jgi:3-aminobutyryl-CoA ammonia-lyase